MKRVECAEGTTMMAKANSATWAIFMDEKLLLSLYGSHGDGSFCLSLSFSLSLILLLSHSLCSAATTHIKSDMKHRISNMNSVRGLNNVQNMWKKYYPTSRFFLLRNIMLARPSVCVCACKRARVFLSDGSHTINDGQNCFVRCTSTINNLFSVKVHIEAAACWLVSFGRENKREREWH